MENNYRICFGIKYSIFIILNFAESLFFMSGKITVISTAFKRFNVHEIYIMYIRVCVFAFFILS